MTIRDLEVANTHHDNRVDTFRVIGERLVCGTVHEQEIWESFTATVTIDWEKLAEFLCTSGQRRFGNSAIVIDSQTYKPKETTLE